ncbi:MAG: hypothetical protein IJZ75_01420 [Clostridia bacterium]|nr:hypothetical protein [Clostridia bacterium]
MKKIIALILCVVSIFVLSVAVSAESSPVADKVYAVTTIVPEKSADISDNVKPATVNVNEGSTFTVTAPATIEKDGKTVDFTGFKVYKNAAATGTAADTEGKVIPLANGLVEAVKGTDYDIVKGSLTETTVEIKPYTDVVVVATYKDVVIDPTTGAVTVQPESPKTGSATAICFAIVALAAAAVTFGAKKQSVR